MKSIKIAVAVISVMVLLTACEEDTPPELDVTGHWIVEHGFYEDQCQVGATFTDELLVLTFYSLQDGACQPELFGIENNALPIQIGNKVDYLNENGALATDLALAVPARGVSGQATLVETVEGLSGAITEASDPEDLLAPLLEPTYKLTRVPEGWLTLVKGKWGTACDQLETGSNTGEVCEVMDFTDAGSGRASIYMHLPTDAAGLSAEPNGVWENLTFALRNVEKTGEGEYTLEFVMVFEEDFSQNVAGTLVATDGAMTLSLFVPVVDGSRVETVELFPIED